ncbi:MAG: DUF3667 domain-containing protein [Acidobacteriia bacterium]|nr:DUF3667 domain-containing protein [Terriglobia bacterium]
MASPPVQSDSAAHQEATSCPNCGKELQGKYCHDCGEKKVHGHDLTLKHFLQHALHEFTHLDSKVFATVRYLFTRPGFLSQEFVAGRRLRYMKPLSLFLIASAVFLVVGSFVMLSGFDVRQLSKADKKGQLDAAWEKIAAKKHLPKEVIVDRVQETMHKVTTALQLADVLAMAGLLALLFRGRYFVEHLVFSLHYFSFTYLAAVLAAPLYAIVTPFTWQSFTLSVCSTLVFFTYLTIGLRRFYGHSAAATVVKAIVTYTITQAVIISTLIVAFVVAVVRAAKS